MFSFCLCRTALFLHARKSFGKLCEIKEGVYGTSLELEICYYQYLFLCDYTCILTRFFFYHIALPCVFMNTKQYRPLECGKTDSYVATVSYYIYISICSLTISGCSYVFLCTICAIYKKWPVQENPDMQITVHSKQSNTSDMIVCGAKRSSFCLSDTAALFLNHCYHFIHLPWWPTLYA